MSELRIPDSLIEIARLHKPFGIAGWIRVSMTSDDPDRLKDIESVTIVRANRILGTYRIAQKRVSGESMYIRFETIESRETAAALTGGYLCIPESSARKLDPDEYFQHEIVGMEVLTVAGNRVGLIESIWDIGPHDVFCVRRDDGSEALIPAVRDTVRKVDLKQKQLLIDPPEGLLDSDTRDAV